MTRYWLTTHWPLASDEKDPHTNIYLQEGRESVARDLVPGDKVLIYELATGRTRLESLADGTIRRVERQRGRQGIVCVADVIGVLRRRASKDARQEYSDGTTMNWVWEAPTARHVWNGFVHLREVNRVLRYGEGSVLRGFGPKASGLGEISRGQYDELLALFSEAPKTAPAPGGLAAPPECRREGGGGEGQEHLDLKEFVAASPDTVFGEPGLATIRVEYPFPSGDQADIVLRDPANRIIGVEIEVEQNERRWEGVLQAIKYRHMLAVMEGRDFEECRSALVAYRVSDWVRSLCQRYQVEVVTPNPADVAFWRKKQGV